MKKYLLSVLVLTLFLNSAFVFAMQKLLLDVHDPIENPCEELSDLGYCDQDNLKDCDVEAGYYCHERGMRNRFSNWLKQFRFVRWCFRIGQDKKRKIEAEEEAGSKYSTEDMDDSGHCDVESGVFNRFNKSKRFRFVGGRFGIEEDDVSSFSTFLAKEGWVESYSIEDLPHEVIICRIFPFLDEESLANIWKTDNTFLMKGIEGYRVVFDMRDVLNGSGFFWGGSLKSQKVIKIANKIREKIKIGRVVKVLCVDLDGRASEEDLNEENFVDVLSEKSYSSKLDPKIVKAFRYLSSSRFGNGIMHGILYAIGGGLEGGILGGNGIMPKILYGIGGALGSGILGGIGVGVGGEIGDGIGNVVKNGALGGFVIEMGSVAVGASLLAGYGEIGFIRTIMKNSKAKTTVGLVAEIILGGGIGSIIIIPLFGFAGGIIGGITGLPVAVIGSGGVITSKIIFNCLDSYYKKKRERQRERLRRKIFEEQEKVDEEQISASDEEPELDVYEFDIQELDQELDMQKFYITKIII